MNRTFRFALATLALLLSAGAAPAEIVTYVLETPGVT